MSGSVDDIISIYKITTQLYVSICYIDYLWNILSGSVDDTFIISIYKKQANCYFNSVQMLFYMVTAGSGRQ